MLASEKLRSPKSRNGSSGSRVLCACHHTNAPSTSSPVAMSSGTEMNPVMVPQS